MPKIPYKKSQFNPKADFSVQAKGSKEWKPLEPGEGGAADIARNLSDQVDLVTVQKGPKDSVDYLVFNHATDGRKFRQKLPEKLKKIHESGFEAAESEDKDTDKGKPEEKPKPKNKPSDGQQGQGKQEQQVAGPGQQGQVNTQDQQDQGQQNKPADVLFKSDGKPGQTQQASSRDHIFRRVAFLISGT